MITVVAAVMLTGLQQTVLVPVAAPPPPDAKAMVRNYLELSSVAPSVVQHCATAGGADITVCGRRDNSQRLPLPEEAGPIDTGHSAGEANADCVARSGGPCAVCPPTGCVGVNLLAVPFKLFRIARAIVDPDH